MPTVEANGVELYYERRGAGPPVVFLHGAGLDHRLWAEFTRPLTDDYEVVVLDRRLHGRSGGDPAQPPSMDTYVDDLHALFDALGLDSPVIVGHSMGGMVALRYADRYPDEISGLITLGSETPDVPTRRAWVYDRLVFPTHDRLREWFGHDVANRFMFAVGWLARDDTTLSDLEEYERIVTEHESDYPEPTPPAQDAIEESMGTYDGLTIAYEAITAPVLAMYGDREMAVLAEYAEHIAASVPNGRTVEIPDAAHLSPVDNPEFVLDTIRAFLDEQLTSEPTAAEND